MNSKLSSPNSLSQISNKALYKKCQKYGAQSRKWAREFAYLLPEVARRNLHRQKGYASIYEFASKLCGLSFNVVQEILRLSNQLEPLPSLWEQVRIVGWSKVRTIAGVVDESNQNYWIGNLSLPKKALEKLVKKTSEEKKIASISDSENFPKSTSTNSSKLLFKMKTCFGEEFGEMGPSQKSDVIKNNFSLLKFNVDRKTEFKFRKFKQALEKQMGRALTMGEVLNILLSKAQHKTKTIRKSNKTIKVGRYIPAAKKHKISEKYQGCCATKGCNHPAEETHHMNRYSLTNSHDSIIPLCRAHHQLAHAGFLDEGERTVAIKAVDRKVMRRWSGIEGLSLNLLC